MPSLTSAEQLWVGKRQMEFMGTWKKQCIRSSEIECSKRKEGCLPLITLFLTKNGWALTKLKKIIIKREITTV